MMTRAQLKALLKAPQLGLSKQQASLASGFVDFDANGSIDPSALAPMLYDVIVEAIAKALAMQDLGEIGKEVERICEQYDKDGSGFIDPRVLKRALTSGFPFLNTFQINSLVSDPRAPTNGDGELAWREYLPKLTSMLKAMSDPNAIRERAEMAARAEFQPAALMSGKEKEEFEEMMRVLFEEADTDHNGTLDREEFKQCMLRAELGLVEWDIEELFEMFDEDKSGALDMSEFLNGGYEVIADLARERAINYSMGEDY